MKCLLRGFTAFAIFPRHIKPEMALVIQRRRTDSDVLSASLRAEGKRTGKDTELASLWAMWHLHAR